MRLYYASKKLEKFLQYKINVEKICKCENCLCNFSLEDLPSTFDNECKLQIVLDEIVASIDSDMIIYLELSEYYTFPSSERMRDLLRFVRHINKDCNSVMSYIELWSLN